MILRPLNQQGIIHFLPIIVLAALVIGTVVGARTLSKQKDPRSRAQVATNWAFEETFDYGVPTAPSQTLLPRTFDYNVTHRSHPQSPDGHQANGSYGTYPADHDEDCTFTGDNSKQHNVGTTHRSNTVNPDESFFLCNNHMMSSMGEVEGYSVTPFWPRQEFDFANGGTLEFDVNLNWQSRNWFEVIISPRDKFNIAPARHDLPIDETYPDKSIILANGRGREIFVFNNPDDTVYTSRYANDWWGEWIVKYPNDPAGTDRRIRRKNIIQIQNNKITWSTQKQDGTFDVLEANIPEGISFTRGLVNFKTHAYTPDKDGVHQRHTFHWDNIRFSGPKLTPYEAYEYSPVINLEANGSKPIGSTETVTINLPRVGSNLFIAGQTHQGMLGQVLLSINGATNISVSPTVTTPKDDPCYFGGWRTFRIPVQASQLRVGANSFKWTVGPRSACAQGQWFWDGFAVKALEVQMDTVGGSTPVPTNTTTPTPVPSPSPSRTPSPSPTLRPSPTVAATPCVREADYDTDCDVDVTDLSFLLSFYRAGDLKADLSHDNRISIADVSVFGSEFGK